MKFAFGAGGTGGHIIPAIAMANELKAMGHECVFIGNKDSMEERLSANNGYEFQCIKVQKLYRKLTPAHLMFPIYLAGSIIRAHQLLRDCDGVITTGGFVSGPVALAAISRKLPCFLHESNSYPGLTTRYLAKQLTRIYISFEDSRRYLPLNKLRNFGIPIVRKDPGIDISLSDIGLKEGKRTLLITGGSQGSLAINEAVSGILNELLEKDWQVIWQTGSHSYQRFSTLHKDTPGLYLFDFSPHLASMMLKASLAITRAGALTIAELEAAKLPAILIPLPTAAENHQYYNALAQKNKGIAELIVQKDLSPQNLLQSISTADTWINDRAMQAVPENNASRDIINDVLSFYKRS
ncbi:MAG: undecaprenyldiphospho-muramoylpentapeptide beta-N-acetylglucosaminyltransferase [Candidatus Cloacimonetes bacterium]|nr:undecaprenyldiphospho-muramoylpentapeptide beta-N-acetylglucosaminyltransferase [Candidatus Cloacimonadota bacterium]HOA29124.1 undecaprenyldiphospho-muramoylpentapeptide beta-N-acetylglucosaminyltransferase [Candidatus Cloacimonadota bacterium]HOH59274.1 undecaprenyldiphospho-muramoylpentapeptide beta-N-acetylglucosaminyltransferase [Candidatus Cloacimonadota bacterium]HPI24969.1 undecaprenyldiphospho-muramoylpentapeptide beta-N-acetylglucosaminyltransferase [Candidatus Cloacimonadota bacter